MGMDTKQSSKETDFTNQLTEAMESKEEPGTELNQQLIRKLKQKEACMKRQEQRKKISLWYVPMLLNAMIFLTAAGTAVLVMETGIIRTMILGFCLYMILAGVALTILGTHFANFKEELVIYTSRKSEGGISL